MQRYREVTASIGVNSFFFQAEDGIRDVAVTGVQTCALPISVLTFLADLSGWLLAGPGRMLQAIDLLERRQVRVQTRSVREPSAAEGMRIRALWLASIWVVLAVVVLECRENLSVNAATFAITGLWAFWTVWL